MASRDRHGKEAKKKPKDRSGVPKLQPMSEPPMNVELIRKPRKERWDKDEDKDRDEA